MSTILEIAEIGRLFSLMGMKYTKCRRQRVKHYRSLLAEWRRLVDDMPELVEDIADLERHVNQVLGVSETREPVQRGGRKRIWSS